jgi:uncharacterized protein
MTIHNDLKKALVEAMKSKDSAKTEAIRYLTAAIQKKEKDSKKELDDQGVIAVISTMSKQRRDSIEQFKQGGRDDLVAKEEAELEFLTSFLPPQLSQDEVTAVVVKAIAAVGAAGPKDMGKVMKQVMQELSGKADGQLISSVVKDELNKVVD